MDAISRCTVTMTTVKRILPTCNRDASGKAETMPSTNNMLTLSNAMHADEQCHAMRASHLPVCKGCSGTAIGIKRLCRKDDDNKHDDGLENRVENPSCQRTRTEIEVLRASLV
jgi:hypothetical protein